MALFKTTLELRKYIPVNKSLDINNLLPLVEEAERTFIIPDLSQAEYTAIEAAYQANTLTPQQENLLHRVRTSLANFTLLLYVPIGQVQISDSGIHILSNEDKKTAFEHQIKKLEKKFSHAGYDGIEFFLEYLEEQKLIFTNWASSTSYTANKDSFINTSKEYNEFVDIRGSRRIFRALKQAIRKVEEFNVLPILGETLFEEIKSQIVGSSLTPANIKLLKYIKPAVAHLAIVKGFENLIIDIGDNGITIYTSSSNTEVVDAYTPAKENVLSTIKKGNEKDGLNYLEQLRNYLLAHAADYPLYTAPTDSNTTISNTSDSPLFIF